MKWPYVQLLTKYLAKSKKIKQDGTKPERFDISAFAYVLTAIAKNDFLEGRLN